MTIPPADHPCYKILHALICVIGLAILATHSLDGGHVATGLDAEDVSGMVGAVAGGNLLRMLTKGLT